MTSLREVERDAEQHEHRVAIHVMALRPIKPSEPDHQHEIGPACMHLVADGDAGNASPGMRLPTHDADEQPTKRHQSHGKRSGNKHSVIAAYHVDAGRRLEIECGICQIRIDDDDCRVRCASLGRARRRARDAQVCCR